MEFNLKNTLLQAALASAEENDNGADNQYELAIAAASSFKFTNGEVSEDFKYNDATDSFAMSQSSEFHHLTYVFAFKFVCLHCANHDKIAKMSNLDVEVVK